MPREYASCSTHLQRTFHRNKYLNYKLQYLERKPSGFHAGRGRIGIWKGWFLWREIGVPEEKHSKQGGNQQVTHPTYSTG